MDVKSTINKNILGLLEYLQRTIATITIIPRTDGTSANELNIYPSVKLLLEEGYGPMKLVEEGRQTEFGVA